MFVIMDMEWVGTHQKEINPTQIAAVRVDDEWNAMDRFMNLIRPRDPARAPWNHMAFTGYRAQAFRAGHSEEQAFACLSHWLLPDDVLLWWADVPLNAFRAVAGRYPHIVLPQPGKCLHATVDSVFPIKGNAYRIAGNRGIKVPFQQHVSLNDVEAIRTLFRGVSLKPEYIDSPPPKKYRVSDGLAAIYPYWYDAVGKLVHMARSDCLLADMRLEPHNSVEECLRSGMKPCPVCCGEKFRRVSRNATADKIKRSEYSFFFSASSKVFHTAECACAFRISYSSIREAGSYKACIASGRIPCKRCNPTQEYRRDQKLPPPGFLRAVPIEEEINSDSLSAICLKFGYGFKECDCMYYITTPVGKWRLEVRAHSLKLWHVNLLRCRGRADKYHRQPVALKTIHAAFLYLHEHDQWLLHRDAPGGRKQPYEFGRQSMTGI